MNANEMREFLVERFLFQKKNSKEKWNQDEMTSGIVFFFHDSHLSDGRTQNSSATKIQ